MYTENQSIQLTVLDIDESYTITAYPGQYRSLMMMLYDQIYLEYFGECLGMGRCATCAISIESTKLPFTQFNRNERVTLSKEGITDPDIHLSCQIVVDESLDGAVIRIYHPEVD